MEMVAGRYNLRDHLGHHQTRCRALQRFNMIVTQLATDDMGANCESGGDIGVKFEDSF
jgi:hypothetical protein